MSSDPKRNARKYTNTRKPLNPNFYFIHREPTKIHKDNRWSINHISKESNGIAIRRDYTCVFYYKKNDKNNGKPNTYIMENQSHKKKAFDTIDISSGFELVEGSDTHNIIIRAPQSMHDAINDYFKNVRKRSTSSNNAPPKKRKSASVQRITKVKDDTLSTSSVHSPIDLVLKKITSVPFTYKNNQPVFPRQVFPNEDVERAKTNLETMKNVYAWMLTCNFTDEYSKKVKDSLQ
jgi:hypothetical protein